MAYEVAGETATGYKKLTPADGDGKPIYQKPDGTFTNQQSFAASKGQEQTAAIRDRETGQIKKRVPKSETIEVQGGTQEVNNGVGFSLDADDGDLPGLQEARDLMQSNPSQWDAFQVRVTAEFACKEAEGEGIVTGWSRVKDEISQGDMKKPVTGMSEEGTIQVVAWETIDADTLDIAQQEAEENAWAKITCSPRMFRVIDVSVKIYAGKQSLWAQQAQEQTHIEL